MASAAIASARLCHFSRPSMRMLLGTLTNAAARSDVRTSASPGAAASRTQVATVPDGANAGRHAATPVIEGAA